MLGEAAGQACYLLLQRPSPGQLRDGALHGEVGSLLAALGEVAQPQRRRRERRPAAVWLLDRCQHPQQRALARPVGAEQRQPLAGVDDERAVAQDMLLAVRLADVTYLQHEVPRSREKATSDARGLGRMRLGSVVTL